MSARITTLSIVLTFAICVHAQPPAEAPKATAAKARAEPSPEVIKAIDKGVNALRQAQYGDGCWGEYGAGSTALAMIALLEANVPTTDPAIIQAARFVRYESLRNSHTYSIACSIIALDRFGDVNDWQLINLLTKRLLNAQLIDGGWGYACKRGELGELEKTIPHPGGTGSNAPARRDQAYSENPPGAISDNSNTQFAILALWIGHRYDVDVDAGLRRAATRFRRTALTPTPGHVGWAYTAPENQPTSAPSCCGLLGLALQHAIGVQRRLKSAPDGKPGEAKPVLPRTDPLKDPMVQDAFRYVNAQFIAESRKQPEPNDHGNFYFLWSFERVAVAYGLDKTFGTDWYQLGVRRILPLQLANGMWTGYYGYEPETCFCLLFLCRSNLTPDLIALLNPDKSAELRTDGTAPAPPPPPEPTAQQLIREFIDAPVEKREKLVADFRDRKGVNYTEALAKLIPKLDGVWPKSLRDALAARLSRMTVATLRDRLKDTDTELRRAAAVAAAMKEDKALIPDLIAVLDDREAWVVRAAGVALNRLTGQDFGPTANATPEQRGKAIAAWKDWWSKQPK